MHETRKPIIRIIATHVILSGAEKSANRVCKYNEYESNKNGFYLLDEISSNTPIQRLPFEHSIKTIERFFYGLNFFSPLNTTREKNEQR